MVAEETPENALKDLDSKKLQEKIDRLDKLGINTYTLVMIWAGLKAFARLAKNLEEGKLPLKYMEQFEMGSAPADEELKGEDCHPELERPKGYTAQAMFARDFEKWDTRAQELRRFIDKYVSVGETGVVSEEQVLLREYPSAGDERQRGGGEG